MDVKIYVDTDADLQFYADLLEILKSVVVQWNQ